MMPETRAAGGTPATLGAASCRWWRWRADHPGREYNFRILDEYAAAGQESMKTADQPYDRPGQSCFLQLQDGVGNVPGFRS